MKRYILPILMLLASPLFAAPSIPREFKRVDPIKVRLTFYHNHEDAYGSRVAMDPSIRAEEGVTVAAHPDFDFGSLIYIPELAGVLGNGQFIVQDRGSAVKTKKASGGREYVIDVFLNAPTYRQAERKMKRFMREYGDYAIVYIKPPQLLSSR